MTSQEHDQNRFEHSASTGWNTFDEYMQKRIQAAAVSIEFANKETVQAQLRGLNNHFVSEGVVSLPARVSTGIPTFMSAELTADGVKDSIVTDPELLLQKQHTGYFKGCVSLEVMGDDVMNLLFYDIELHHETYQPLHLYVPVDEGRIEVLYPESDEWEEDVLLAFSTLEAIDDDEYQAVVEGLQEAFWDIEQPAAQRMSVLGLFATELLAHPRHVASPDAVSALGEILLRSVDEEQVYSIRGYAVNETREDDGRPLLAVTHKENERIIKPLGVAYVTNFEIIQANGKMVEVELTNALQPAFMCLDLESSQEVAYPFRYIAAMSEYDDYAHYDARSRSIDTFSRYSYGATGTKTCGELSHEYNQRFNTTP